MAYQRVPNTAEVVVRYEMAGNPFVNIYHAERSAPYAQIDLDALATAVDSGPAASLLADLSLAVDYVRTDVRGLNAENDMTATDNSNAGVGGNSNTPLPNHSAFAIQKRSGLTGRTARGRVYIGGIPRAFINISAGEYDEMHPTFAAVYVAHVDGFRTGIDAVGLWDPVIVSRYSAGVKRAEGVTFPWVSSTYRSLKLATQRKRMT